MPPIFFGRQLPYTVGQMLIYDPTVDPYHCAIRVLAVLENANSPLPVDSVRIADYYLAYPAALSTMRLPSDVRTIRKLAKALVSPYRNPLAGRSTFERARPIFQAAMSSLVAVNLIDGELLRTGMLVRSNHELPEELSRTISGFMQRQQQIRRFVVTDLVCIPLLGSNGLKDRSGLMEHRYDPA